MRLVVITGVSGAGKTTALRALEDLGFYCADNLPLPLLPRFAELLSREAEVERAALVVDAREKEFLKQAAEAFASLEHQGHQVEVLFLDAPDDVLVRRFSQTRRRHPLSGEDLREGLARERALLQVLRDLSGEVVETGALNVHELKELVQERYRLKAAQVGITFLSFGFKHGLPAEASLVFDVRFLPNPYFVPELSPRSGHDAEVARFVLDGPDAQALLGHVTTLLRFVLPRATEEGRAYFTVAVGCTGGRHRSVAVVEELARRLADGYAITVRHRDVNKGFEP
jgi:UPF0042 nucleotide-binding protein